MAIELYLVESSPPCRAVMLVAKYLGIDLNKKHIDWMEKEHMTPEFLKMSPLHCVPAIDDNGFYLWESRAIITYLVNQYAPESDIYPKDPQKRAAIDKLLYFDISILHRSLLDAMSDPIFYGKERNPEKEDILKAALQYLDGFLKETPYVAGDTLSLADFSILITLNTAELMTEAIDFDYSSFHSIQDWEKRMKNHLPFFDEVNKTGEDQMRSCIQCNEIV